MKSALPLVMLLAALAAGGCIGDDDDDGGDRGAPRSAKGSSVKCLELSGLESEPYEEDARARPAIQPLLTPGAKATEIRTGKLAAVVIEYPDSHAAVAAHRRALKSKPLKREVRHTQIQAFERTLFIDYAKDPDVKRTILACATKPDQKPPA